MAALAQTRLVSNGHLRWIDPMKVCVAMLARVGIGGEVLNIARTAIRTFDGFIGHGS